MSILRAFWNDESGVVVSAELVTVATVGVLGITTGLGVVASATNDELIELSKAIRSLDQSYSVQGRTTCCAFTASSSYTQTPVVESIAELCAGPLTRGQSPVLETKAGSAGTPAEARAPAIEVPVQVLPNGGSPEGTVSPADAILNPQ